MNSYEVYQNYLALKFHFQKWDYDYFLFGGKTNASVKAFENRKDKMWFVKLSQIHSPHERLLANISLNERAFIRDIVNDGGVYLEWQARQDALTLIFTKEIERLKSVFNDNFLFTPGSHPYLIREYLGGRISLETITIICDLTECVPYWEGCIDDDPLFENVVRRIMKYTPFLKYDMETFRKILIEKVEET